MTKHAGLIAAAIIMAAALNGCSDALVFGEKSGFNLAINVNDDPSTPIHVNAGFERKVGTVVPPLEVTKDDKGHSAASGEAVSLFSGFQLKYDEPGIPTPFSGKLTIRTQFASGLAAQDISNNQAMVAKVVTGTDQASLQLDEVDRLSDAAALSLARNPPVHTALIDNAVKARDPKNLRLTDPAAARQILKMEIALSQHDPDTLAAWDAALQSVE